MAGERKVIITIAPTGGMADKSTTPHLPMTPEEIAEDVYQCWRAGASVAAIHARRADGQATCDPKVYSRINELVRARCDIVINNSTGGGVNGDMVSILPDGRREISFDERIKGTMAGAEMCTFDPQMLCVRFGDDELIHDTSWSRCIRLAEAMKERNIKPEWEVMSLPDLMLVERLIALGYDQPPHYINIVMNNHKAVTGTTAYTPRNLLRFVEDLPKDSLFGVSGIGAAQLPASVQSIIMGGQARVGLEDNIYYAHHKLATNLQLVERIVRILRELNLEPATAAEARTMLGLPLPRVAVH
jgi:3-keto-5-aminohexanoate cleavage enzyme